jgi:DNA-binding transcriptional regulator YbjK
MTAGAQRRIIERGVGGRRNAVRAEQLRAAGLSNRAIARALQIPVTAVTGWFELQDELVLADADGAQ